MRHRGFLAWLVLMAALPVSAEDIEDISALHDNAERFLHSALAEQYVGVSPDNVEINLNPIDPRLRLGRCEQPVDHIIASPQPYGSNISLKLQCRGNKPWSIYLSAKIDTFAPVAVISRSMNRGDIITAADVELAQVNTAQAGYGYIGALEQVVGKELKRRLQTGTTLRLSHLRSPEAVKKGDKVLLEAAMAGISVVTNAKALAAGQVGEQIRVVNSKSKREVDAIVVAPGRVKVLL